MDKPEIFRDVTPKQWYLVAYNRYCKTATPDFLRGLQAGFEAVTETGNGISFLRGIKFALVNPNAALLAGVETGISLANHDGWRFVPVAWMQEYKANVNL